tara:strand:+ start:236 stop:859 length:624 start_codon:yes stop_codon:yes gene_type:complete
MSLTLNLISLIFLFLFNISVSNALILSKNFNEGIKNSENILFINGSKIGIVDFRNILKESLTMKKLGKEFLKLEKRLNDKIKKEENILRNKELKLSSNKNKISNEKYNTKKNKLKKEITKLQKFAFTEKKELNLSFQLIQKKLRDVLASIIKTMSKDKNIDVVILKENIFLINNFDIDLTNEALKKFDEKTSNLKIQFVKKKVKKIE